MDIYLAFIFLHSLETEVNQMPYNSELLYV